MTARSLVQDNKQIQRAIALINLGARLQVLQSETDLPYERLLKLYKEVTGRSPSKGQLPFSTDWFMSWQPNIHSSLFFNIYQYLNKTSDLDTIEAVMQAYQLYASEVRSHGVEALLSVTRAWRLVKFVDSSMLCLTTCTRCKGQFINHTFELTGDYVCGLCNPPARAGKARRAGAIH